MHNGFVVPYNADSLLHFDAHVNVEYCGWSMLIKSLFKYISNGTNMIRFAVTGIDSDDEGSSYDGSAIIDEISNYVDDRFLCP